MIKPESWSSSFAPKYGTLRDRDVGVPVWHKHDPVTAANFRAEMMRKNCGWYHNPAEDKNCGQPGPRKHVPGGELKRRLGLPDETLRALVVHKQHSGLKLTRDAYKRTLARSLRRTIDGQNQLEPQLRRFRPSLFRTMPLPKTLPLIERSRRTSVATRRTSVATAVMDTTAITLPDEYAPWDPPALPGQFGSQRAVVS